MWGYYKAKEFNLAKTNFNSLYFIYQWYTPREYVYINEVNSSNYKAKSAISYNTDYTQFPWVIYSKCTVNHIHLPCYSAYTLRCATTHIYFPLFLLLLWLADFLWAIVSFIYLRIRLSILGRLLLSVRLSRLSPRLSCSANSVQLV